MAQLLGQVNPGTIVKLNENGQPVDFYVAKQDYESGLNGQGRVLLVRKDVYDNRQWNTSNTSTWESSSMLSWLNSVYLNLLDEDVKTQIGTTTYYYTLGNGNNTLTTRSDAVFLLSLTELGQSNTNANVEGSALSIATTLQIAYLNNIAARQWTRSPSTGGTDLVWWLNSDSSVSSSSCTSIYGSRPAFTLSSTMFVESDGTITLPPTLSIYVPSLAMQGQSLPIQWSPISNATSYQLQRNTGSTWETVYTGTDTSYTDTVGSWTTVQYQVAVDIGGGYGAYSQSASIPVIATSTLAISGQDGSLGTITADIPYTVTSDTGNPISIVRTVNGVQYGARTVESGFAYNIPVMELPTGDGTIVITASVQSSSGLVTVTRTWTYTKTPINFSNSGSVASLSVNGQNILPTTLAEAVRTSPVWGGSLDLALQKLSSAAFYETVTPTAELGSLTPGDIIYLNENGSPVEFYVASLNYESSNNTNRVLVVRKDAVQQGAWNSSGVNTYDGSTIDTWMNGTYLQTLDSDVQTAIGTTNIPYTPMGGDTSVQRISKAVFALSVTELNGNWSSVNVEGSQLPIATKIYINGEWTRSPQNNSNSIAIYLRSNISSDGYEVNASYPYRPAFTLPTTFIATTSLPTTGLYDIQNNLLLSIPGVNIETGSYVGTGVTGSENKNQLTFGFVPKYWGIVGYKNEYSSYTAYIGCEFFPWGQFNITHGDGPTSNGDYQLYAYYEGEKVSWYGTSDTAQFNHTGWTYYYWAIG